MLLWNLQEKKQFPILPEVQVIIALACFQSAFYLFAIAILFEEVDSRENNN